jgi:ABC-2 type transport system permease protein
MKAIWKQTWAISRKELGAYFGSPMALIFVGAFLVATLFAFFWAETFFARGIADVRPLFRWMPILLVFLVAALTMRQWSEEQRGGTMEVLLTMPVRRSSLVIGKFIAVMILVLVSLALTLFLPITVSILGNLDWGPVFGGYLAALLMAAAYAAIGLYISSRTDNQIVSLLLTVLIGGALYLVGTQGITQLVGDTPAEILRAIGTGSRFESIERGVIDLRDLVYYLSLAALFLVLNVVALDSRAWGRGAPSARRRFDAILRVVLVVANLLALNAWLFPQYRLRADITAQREYSLSPATINLISNLSEPLLLRGYFSERTHPLLAPLVPTLRDIMREYGIMSRGKIRVEIVDPRQNEALEEEANSVYGIQPQPFRVAGRYEESVISSYFNILIRYGDQNVVLGFADLIEVTPTATGYDVGLRNPEYDLTRSIKKVVYGFQSLDAVFAGMQDTAKLTAYVTPKTLPADFQGVPELIDKVAAEIAQQSNGKFTYQIVDLDAPNAPISKQKLREQYGIQAFAVSPFSPDTYYLHLLLQVGKNTQITYPTGQMTEADVRNAIEGALRRTVPGFLKTVGLWAPPNTPIMDPFGYQRQPTSSYTMLQDMLSQNYSVEPVDLQAGSVPGNVDVLVIVAPQKFTDKELYTIDQYLMRGGSVVIATGSYILSPLQLGTGIMMDQVKDGVGALLEHYGVRVGDAFVMDPQNEPFPMPVQRKVGQITINDIQQINYPFFVDVRRDGMTDKSPIVGGLQAVTLQWASPLELDPAKNEGREVVTLLKSTSGSWLRQSLDVQPNPQAYPKYGFPVEGEQKSQTLAVSIRGVFTSYFKGKGSPYQPTPAAGKEPTPTVEGLPAPKTLGVIEQSPDTARLVVIGSSEFLDDTVLNISRNQSADRYLNNLQLLQNAVDWSVEDADLLTIRSRGTFARLLQPLTPGEESFWEILNYVVALLGLGVLAFVWNRWRRREKPMALVAVKAEAGKGGK